MKKFYVTTPIFYPSGKPHLGHAYSTLYASLLADYKRLLGYDSFFLTGTDEHGQKIQDTAKKENLTPQQLVDRNSQVFIDLWNTMGIKYDYFIRTTNPNHKLAVQKTFETLLSKGYIYLGVWKGLYCVSCEENYTETNAKKVDDKLYCEHGHNLIEKNEESYFLKLKLFNKWIIDLLSNNKEFLYPENRAKELINNFLIDDKLEDLSITRTTFDWGIKPLSNPKHVVYVWLDALLNYITALGYTSDNNELLNKYWLDKDSYKVHLIGKEITRFHCIYWPIMLKMLDLPLPDKIISHGWIITDTGKMSKSLGNVINPIDVIEKYGRDAFRYFLIKEISLKEDSVFSDAKCLTAFNTDLANNYGNLISRTIGMLKKYNDYLIPKFNGPITELDKNVIEQHKVLLDNFKKNIEDLNLKEMIESICKFEDVINLYVEQSKPWEFKKNNEVDKLNSFLSILANSIRTIVFCLKPILIDTTISAIQQLNLNDKLLTLDSLTNFNLLDNHKVNESTPLFVRKVIE